MNMEDICVVLKIQQKRQGMFAYVQFNRWNPLFWILMVVLFFISPLICMFTQYATQEQWKCILEAMITGRM